VANRAIGRKENLMAAASFNRPAGVFGIIVTRKKPGHFVALSDSGRTDAFIAQNGVKLADALERRAAINVTNVQSGPTDGSGPLTPLAGVKTVDPYDVTIAMPAEDGEPCVSEADHEAWKKFRVAYNVTLEAPPFTVTGVLLMMPSQDPLSLTERGTELFLPVFDPSVQFGGAGLPGVPRDVILVNRAHIRRVNATMR
jgi:hypothetical protein